MNHLLVIARDVAATPVRCILHISMNYMVSYSVVFIGCERFRSSSRLAQSYGEGYERWSNGSILDVAESIVTDLTTVYFWLTIYLTTPEPRLPQPRNGFHSEYANSNSLTEGILLDVIT